MKNLNLESAFSLIFLLPLCLYTSCTKEESFPELQEEVPAIISNSNLGCIDPSAMNFEPDAAYSNNSCKYEPVACSDCDYVIEPEQSLVDNETLMLPLGAKIGIRGGERVTIDIRNFQGTKEKPYLFVNCDGQALLNQNSSPEAIRVRNSSHLRLTGTGSTDTYGIKIEMGSQGVRAYERADNIEIDHLDISGVGVGIWSVTRPTCDGNSNRDTYVQENTSVHHNHVHDVEGEGMYIGGSKWESSFSNNDCPGVALFQADLKGVRVFNNLVENTGWDGIQVGGAIEDCEVYNNVIRNYGLLEAGPHQAGMMINPGTTGKIYANTIDRGTGNGIHTIGFDNLIYSNLIIGSGKNAIHVGDRSPLTGKSYRILNNSIVNITGKALNLNSKESVNNVFYNNFMANIGDEKLLTSAENTDISHNVMTSLVEDYIFADVTNWDLTPTSNNSLLDSGRSYDREEIPVDLLLRTRLVGDNLDIGAFEKQSQND